MYEVTMFSSGGATMWQQAAAQEKESMRYREKVRSSKFHGKYGWERNIKEERKNYVFLNKDLRRQASLTVAALETATGLSFSEEKGTLSH